MVQPFFKAIYLRDADGGITPFDPEALQTRLLGAFHGAGLDSESFISGDIVLALEYTLLRSPRPEPIFSCGEADAAVIRLLESCGFPEVARLFRCSGNEQIVQFSTTVDALRELLSSHLGCSEQRTEKVVQAVGEAMAKLAIPAASPQLLLELARHYERDLAEHDFAGDNVAEQPELPAEVTISRAEIRKLLPEYPRLLTEAGVLRIKGISGIFPAIHLTFYMNEFARMCQWSVPVTELEMTPVLYRAGTALEEARRAITEHLGANERLPVVLVIPDMFDFLSAMMQYTPTETLAAEFAAVLSEPVQGGVDRLSFD